MPLVQRQLPVAPKCSVVPAPKGSFLLHLRCTVINNGAVWEFTAMSSGDSMSGVKASMEGQVNSPERINQKNAKQKAAQSISLSKVTGCCDHILNILVSTFGVIGSRAFLRGDE